MNNETTIDLSKNWAAVRDKFADALKRKRCVTTEELLLAVYEELGVTPPWPLGSEIYGYSWYNEVIPATADDVMLFGTEEA